MDNPESKTVYVVTRLGNLTPSVERGCTYTRLYEGTSERIAIQARRNCFSSTCIKYTVTKTPQGECWEGEPMEISSIAPVPAPVSVPAPVTMEVMN